jgi:hypothetical protein
MTFIYYLKRKHTIDKPKDKVYAAGAENNKPKPTKKIYQVRLLPLRKLQIVKQVTYRTMD